MMFRFFSIAALLVLASCGADGEPETPTAKLNVGVSKSGVQAGALVGMRRGPLAVNVSIF